MNLKAPDFGESCNNHKDRTLLEKLLGLLSIRQLTKLTKNPQQFCCDIINHILAMSDLCEMQQTLKQRCSKCIS